ncbi:MAG: DNA-methyltransferase [Promethearchaeota archaeon]
MKRGKEGQMSFRTKHEILIQPAQDLKEIPDDSINLIVTSPPYPMIEMWDDVFSGQNEEIKNALENLDGDLAFKLMHDELFKVWKECYRVLLPGGIACINIGDATRTIDNNFKLYPSHARIIENCLAIGFQSLPEILWRKPTNAPNKFMGSGMLPPNAYVTLEHEYLLIFRKGSKREFKSKVLKNKRRNSAFFWEERNQWFSDVWDLKGISQVLSTTNTRMRSAAFPFELAYRLVNMFSIEEDMILDPFLGTGTTMFAAMASCRNSIGIEIDENFLKVINEKLLNIVQFSNDHVKDRILQHLQHVSDRIEKNKPLKHLNVNYGFPVVTSQEKNIKFYYLKNVSKISDKQFEVLYEFNDAKYFTGKLAPIMPK